MKILVAISLLMFALLNMLQSAPLPRPFNPEEFLATLESSGPQLTTGIKGDWSGLYKKFFRSINFSEWYNMRYREAAEKLQALHLEIMSDSVILLEQLLHLDWGNVILDFHKYFMGFLSYSCRIFKVGYLEETKLKQ